MEEVVEEAAEAGQQRLIEAEAPFDLLDDLERRLWPGDRARRVVRRDVEEHEHQHADDEQRQQPGEGAPQDEADDHGRTLTRRSTRRTSKASRRASPSTLS